MLSFFLTIISLPDGGPIYIETHPERSIVEPYNAFSSLAYLIPAIYWFYKIRNRLKDFSFLAYCLPLLVIGGLGSTFYHAFRSSSLLLLMDVLPIAILTFSVSVYFWIKLLSRWWYIFFILIPFFLSRYIAYLLISGEFKYNIELQTGISISYFVTGVMIFLPSLLLMKRMKFNKSFPAILSCLLSILGLAFRELETWNQAVLPMGTHWLWHIFTAAGAGFLGLYIYNLRENEILNSKF